MNIRNLLTKEQLDITNNLSLKIKSHINKNGPILVSDYMQFALYDLDYGYYLNSQKKFTDFSTAPMISEMFSITISNHFIELFNEGEVNRNILEIGAGNGKFLIDILPSIIDKIDKYFILEISPELKKLQRQKVLELNKDYLDKIEWIDLLPNNFNGIIFANELLDAFPCDVVVLENENFFLRFVDNSDDKFLYLDKKLEYIKNSKILYDSFAFEVNNSIQDFLNKISLSLSKGYIIFIDYGYSQNELLSKNKSTGTLRGFFNNHLVYDILQLPGIIDLTSSVNFSLVAKCLEKNQLDFIGYCSQSNFLINNNILDLVTSIKDKLNSIESFNLKKKINYLLGLEEMGEVFKVIEYAKNINYYDVTGFKYGDLSHTL